MAYKDTRKGLKAKNGKENHKKPFENKDNKKR
jgi:hypothetical protein